MAKRKLRENKTKTVLEIMAEIDCMQDKQAILVQLLPAIRMMFEAMMVRRSIFDKTLWEEMWSDVTMHLWDIISRGKVDFSVKPQQIAAFLVRDITFTIGRYFQINKKRSYMDVCAVDSELGIDPVYEQYGDVVQVLAEAKRAHADWCLRYSSMLGRDISKSLQRVILRHMRYEAVLEYVQL